MSVVSYQSSVIPLDLSHHARFVLLLVLVLELQFHYQLSVVSCQSSVIVAGGKYLSERDGCLS